MRIMPTSRTVAKALAILFAIHIHIRSAFRTLWVQAYYTSQHLFGLLFFLEQFFLFFRPMSFVFSFFFFFSHDTFFLSYFINEGGHVSSPLQTETPVRQQSLRRDLQHYKRSAIVSTRCSINEIAGMLSVVASIFCQFANASLVKPRITLVSRSTSSTTTWRHPSRTPSLDEKKLTSGCRNIRITRYRNICGTSGTSVHVDYFTVGITKNFGVVGSCGKTPIKRRINIKRYLCSTSNSCCISNYTSGLCVT